MRNTLIAAGLLAMVIPGAAMAQSYDPGCVRSNQDNRAAGTVLGAIGGALIGNAVAGRHDKGAGTVIGGIGGAVAGNAIAGANNHPCPAGYVYAQPPAAAAPPPPRAFDRQGGGRDFWAGSPQGIHERIDFMQERVDRATRSGWVSRREARGITGEMGRIRSEERRLRDQDRGRLSPPDRDYLQSLLDNLSQRIHWAEHS